MNTRHPALIINPKAGPSWRRLKARSLTRYLKERFPGLSVHPTRGPGDGRALAKKLSDEKADLIIAAGGDGTYNEVINGMAGTSIPLGILPMGTGNSLVRELGFSVNPFRAVDQLRGGTKKEVFLGKMDERYFSLMVSAGFDASVIQAVSPRAKRLGMAAYALRGILHLFQYDFPEIPFLIDGREVRGTCGVISKAHSYGGPFSFAPGARLDRPEFILVVLKGRGPWTYLKYSLGVITGLHRKMAGVEFHSGKTVEIPIPVPLQVDGEGAGTGKLHVEIDPRPFSMVYPPDGKKAVS